MHIYSYMHAHSYTEIYNTIQHLHIDYYIHIVHIVHSYVHIHIDICTQCYITLSLCPVIARLAHASVPAQDGAVSFIRYALWGGYAAQNMTTTC